MVFLKTRAGWISSRWIVAYRQASDGSVEVGYTYGNGMLETSATLDDVARFRTELGKQ